MSSTGTGEGRTGSRRRQSRANNYSISNINRKGKADYTWTGQFMCFSDCHTKKMPTIAEKEVLQNAGLGLKKIKLSAEDDEVAVKN